MNHNNMNASRIQFRADVSKFTLGFCLTWLFIAHFTTRFKDKQIHAQKPFSCFSLYVGPCFCGFCCGCCCIFLHLVFFCTWYFYFTQSRQNTFKRKRSANKTADLFGLFLSFRAYTTYSCSNHNLYYVFGKKITWKDGFHVRLEIFLSKTFLISAWFAAFLSSFFYPLRYTCSRLPEHLMCFACAGANWWMIQCLSISNMHCTHIQTNLCH